jgi:hypothetical protein
MNVCEMTGHLLLPYFAAEDASIFQSLMTCPSSHGLKKAEGIQDISPSLLSLFLSFCQSGMISTIPVASSVDIT